jgi:hypothetical protein
MGFLDRQALLRRYGVDAYLVTSGTSKLGARELAKVAVQLQ